MRRSFIRLKSCPRCRGDVLVDKAFEDSELCIQCGYRGAVRLAYHDHLLDQEEKKGKRKLISKPSQSLTALKS